MVGVELENSGTLANVGSVGELPFRSAEFCPPPVDDSESERSVKERGEGDTAAAGFPSFAGLPGGREKERDAVVVLVGSKVGAPCSERVVERFAGEPFDVLDVMESPCFP
jgi:hypothetical protein